MDMSSMTCRVVCTVHILAAGIKAKMKKAMKSHWGRQFSARIQTASRCPDPIRINHLWKTESSLGD